jgi:hypothetical protein
MLRCTCFIVPPGTFSSASRATSSSRANCARRRLTVGDRQSVEALFARGGSAAITEPDAFRYRVTRQVGARMESVGAPEHDVPLPLRACVQDEQA